VSTNPLDDCIRCPLSEFRLNRNVVPVRFHGPRDARLLIVGDNPTIIESDSGKLFEDEDRHGLLRGILAEVGIDPAILAFTYATRCSLPFSSSKLTKTEVYACRPWLQEEIEAHPDVQVVVPLGKVAISATLTVSLVKSGGLRGQLHEIAFGERKIRVIPTVHPYQALLSAADREALTFDLGIAKNYATPGWTPFSMADHKLSHLKSYRMVTKPEDLRLMVDRLLRAPLVAFDTETRGLDPWHIRDGSPPEQFVSTIQFSDGDDVAFFVPVVHQEVPIIIGDQAEWYETVCAEMHRFFGNYTGRLTAFNAKFDQVGVLASFGCEPRIFFDGMIYDHVRRGLPARSLKKIAWEVTPYGGYEQDKRVVDAEMDQVGHANDSFYYPLDTLFWYGCLDAEVTYRLAMHFLPEITSTDKKQKRLKFLSSFLADASNALSRIEADGWRVSMERLEQYGVTLRAKQAEIEAKIVAVLGPALDEFVTLTKHEFVLTSLPHLQILLYQILRLPETRYTPKGRPSTARLALTELVGQHPVVPLLLEYRKVEKLYNAFYERWKTGVARDGRLHFRYNLVSHYDETGDDSGGAITGRLSSSGAAGNIQQVPKNPDLRHVFLPDDEDSVILDIDFATLEYVVTAIHSEEPKLVEAFKAGYDVHSAVAAELFGKTPSEMKLEENKPLRQKAKTVNFAVLYGAGAKKVGEQLGIPEQEADAFIKSYLARYPALKAWLDKIRSRARRTGYSESRFGRRRVLTDALLSDSSANLGRINAALRQAVNTPIQADASDLCLWGLIRLRKWLDNSKRRAKILATIHDSIVLSVPNEELLEVAYKARDILEHPELPFIDGPATPGVPLRVTGAEGPDWGSCTEFSF
jgi:DNA polymerase-1